MADAAVQLDQSPYQFSWNNPTNLNDPSGECPLGCGGLIGAYRAVQAAGESHRFGTVGVLAESLFNISPGGQYKRGMEKVVQGKVNKINRTLNYSQNAGQIYDNALANGNANQVQSSIEVENLIDDLKVAEGVLDATVATTDMAMLGAEGILLSPAKLGLGAIYNTAEEGANVARNLGRNSGAAAELRIGDEVFLGVSGEGVPPNPQVTGALMGTPASSRAKWHGGCAEIAYLDKATNSGLQDLSGGRSKAVNIGRSGAGHGTTKPVCSSCVDVLNWFGIEF